MIEVNRLLDECRDSSDATISAKSKELEDRFSTLSLESVERLELCEEALRLSSLIATLMPDQPEASGLHALILLHDSRRTGGDLARPDGGLGADAIHPRGRLGRAGRARPRHATGHR